MRSLRSILVVGEKRIFSDLNRIISIASEANDVMKIMFKADYGKENLFKNVHAIRILEKKSDEITFKLSEDITGGAISPNIIDNLIECVQVADDIVDLYYFLCRELNRMSKVDSTDFAAHQDSQWVSVYENLFELAGIMLTKLGQMLSTGSVPEILQLRKEIEILEEQGDDIKDTGFDNLYAAALKLHYVQFYHYTEMLHKCDALLDACEDLSDLLVSVVTSILK